MLQALQRDKVAQEFCIHTEKIEEALTKIKYEKLDLSEEVREQVLLATQLIFIQ